MTAAPMVQTAHAAGSEDWNQLADACLAGLDPRAGATLGFVYASDHLATEFDAIVAHLRGVTGIAAWVGTAGLGIMGDGQIHFDEPALSVMTAALPADSLRLIDPTARGGLEPDLAAWVAARPGCTAIVHGDGRDPGLADRLDDLADLARCATIGGLGSSRVALPQVAGATGMGPVSGVILAPGTIAAIDVTQGCAPLGPGRHRITRAEGGLIETLDDRPALEALHDDLLQLPPDERDEAARRLHVALPIAGGGDGDYLVRNIVGIDPSNGTVAIGDAAEPGRELIFVRRDRAGAAQDLRAMAARARRKAPAARAALYFSCIARGPNLFPAPPGELGILRAGIGDIPLTGLFCDGEIFGARLYGYTGVLALLA
jgi:small ligand-binding sensory domain FIST